jgi:hypothetical protein
MIKIKRCKRKIKRKTENIHKCKLDLVPWQWRQKKELVDG